MFLKLPNLKNSCLWWSKLQNRQKKKGREKTQRSVIILYLIEWWFACGHLNHCTTKRPNVSLRKNIIKQHKCSNHVVLFIYILLAYWWSISPLTSCNNFWCHKLESTYKNKHITYMWILAR